MKKIPTILWDKLDGYVHYVPCYAPIVLKGETMFWPPRYSDFDPSCTQVIHRIRHCKQAEKKNGIPGDKFGPGFGVKMGEVMLSMSSSMEINSRHVRNVSVPDHEIEGSVLRGHGHSWGGIPVFTENESGADIKRVECHSKYGQNRVGPFEDHGRIHFWGMRKQ